jgi:cytoskeletal protein RodZ
MSEDQDLATLESRPAVTEPRTPGEWLRAERQRQGRSVQQIADEMHLGVNMVEAMENDQFSFLGAPVFARGHLRKYATLLGVPVDRVQELYHAVADRPRDADPVPLSHRATDTMMMSPDSKQRRAAHAPIKNWSIVGACAGLLAIGLSGWLLFGRQDSVPASQPEAAEFSQASAGEADVESTPPAMGASIPVAAAAAAPLSQAQPAGVKSQPGAGQTGALPQNVARTARGKLNLRFTFTQESWVEVYDAQGTRLLYDVGQPGQSRGVEVDAPAQIVLGMAGAVTAEVNGKTIEVPPRRVANQVARFTVGADGIAQ